MNEQFKKLAQSPLISVSGLCKKSGINRQTIQNVIQDRNSLQQHHKAAMVEPLKELVLTINNFINEN